MKTFITIIIVAVVAIGAWLLLDSSRTTAPTTMQVSELTPSPFTSTSPAGSATPTPVVSASPKSRVDISADVSVGTKTKTFTVTGSNFSFNPKEMRVKEGDTVVITFVNAGGTHDFVLEAFNARTKIIEGNARETIQFVANKKGTFEYYCSVGTHRQMGMRGNLIVE